MSYKVLWESKGIKMTIEGNFSNGILKINEQLLSNSRFNDVEYFILDILKVENFTIDSESIRNMARSDQEAYLKNPRIKQAIIANDEVMTDFVNIYTVYFEFASKKQSWVTEIFETEEAARKWLDA